MGSSVTRAPPLNVICAASASATHARGGHYIRRVTVVGCSMVFSPRSHPRLRRLAPDDPRCTEGDALYDQGVVSMAEVVTPGGALAGARKRFSALQTGFAFMDAPGGSQVPDEVGDAVARALREASANLGAGYETSFRVKRILEEAEAKAARFLGCASHEVTFGTNMTTLNFVFSRTAGRDFKPGDEIIVSSLDHDGGVAPWRELAADRDLVLKHVELNPDSTYNFDDL